MAEYTPKSQDTITGKARVSFNTPTGRAAISRVQTGSNKKLSLRAAFKSPIRKDAGTEPTFSMKECPEDIALLKKEIKRLQERESNLDGEIVELTKQGYKEEELQIHITKMHEYNEMKDIGQMLLGRIAHQEGVTTRDLYPKFGLELED